MILARDGDKQTRRHNIAKTMFWQGVSEIQCIIFEQNNVNVSEFYNNYIALYKHSVSKYDKFF